MLLETALRELLYHRGRTLLALAGVAVSSAMLVDMLMLGGGLQASFTELLEGRGYRIRIFPEGTLPLETDVTIPDRAALTARLAREAGVDGVAPVLAANLLLPDRGDRRVFALGIDPAEQGVLRLQRGRLPEGPAEMVVSTELAAAERITPGDSLRLLVDRGLGASAGGTTGRFRVTGTADFLYASTEERDVALPIGALERLTGRRDRASFFMVRPAPGVSVDSVVARLRATAPHLGVASIAALVRRAGQRLAYFRQLAGILGAVSLVVTVLLVGTIMAVSVDERLGTIAALRAIGLSRRSLVTTLAAESLFLCVGGGVAGLGGGLLLSRYLESILSDFPGIPRAVRFFVLQPADLLRAGLIVLAAAALAALLPAWRAMRVRIAAALHEEEP